VRGVLHLEAKEAASLQFEVEAETVVPKADLKKTQQLEDIAERLLESGFESSVLIGDEVRVLREALRDFHLIKGIGTDPPRLWWEQAPVGSTQKDRNLSTEDETETETETARLSRYIASNREQFCRDMTEVRDVLLEIRGERSCCSRPELSIITESTETTQLASESSPKLPRPTKALGLHILAILLGYVVMLRSVAGDWTLSIQDAYEVFVLSCPAMSPTFQPLTVAEVVAAWLDMNPPTLDRRRKNWTIIFRDVVEILKESHSVVYALIDCWMLSLSLEVTRTALRLIYSHGNKLTVRYDMLSYPGIVLI